MSSGRMKERSRAVSSITSTMEDMGPGGVAASTAAAPTTANKPGGTPGHAQDHASPSAAPSSAPRVSDGVNNPPGTPLPRHSAVANGFSTSSTSNSIGAT